MNLDFQKFLAQDPIYVSNFLEQRGFNVVKNETKPPYAKNPQGKKRVIALQKINPESINLIWSHERYN